MLKAEIIAAWLVMSCGHVLLWRRRDNLFGYLQVAFFVAACVIPVLGTSVVDDADPAVATRYADVMMLGALAYMPGLAIGGNLASRARLPNVTFGGAWREMLPTVALNARRIAIGGAVVLVGSFALLGYVPLLAGDRLSAKYGVGPYAAGFARGGLVLNAGLAIAGTILPVMLVLVMRHRRALDVAITGVVFVGLLSSLSRQTAFIGPLVFLVALAIERRWRAWAIVLAVSAAYLVSPAFNSLMSLTPQGDRKSFVEEVAAATPDISDHIGFVDGFERRGKEQIGLRPLRAAIAFDKEAFDPSEYALRVRTGLDDVSGLATGGLRIPPAEWGMASYGTAGAAGWCFISGIFIGMGTVVLRRALTPGFGRPGMLVRVVLAWVFYKGTFGVLGEFYFLPRVSIIAFGLAVVLGLSRRAAPAAEEEQDTPERAVPSSRPTLTPSR
jgi:hypothetical protein